MRFGGADHFVSGCLHSLFVFTRPVAVKYFNKDRQKTNADRLVGQEAIVTEDIYTLQAHGTVEVNGQGVVGKNKRGRLVGYQREKL